MCAFRFSQFMKKDEQTPLPVSAEESSVEPDVEPEVVVEPEIPEVAPVVDPLEDESIKNLRGLDNLIKELQLEPEEDLVQESKFYRRSSQLIDLFHQLVAPEENELSWQDICERVSQFGLAIEEEFGDFWIEALDAEFAGGQILEQRHNINACIISLELARVLKYQPGAQLSIAAAALLYDIGGAGRVSWENISPEEERGLIDRSVNILRKAGAPADVLRAVSECNERADGSGSPSQLQGSQISLKGQLLGMVVAFERLFRKEQESFKTQGTAFQPVMQMLKIHRNHFNSQVLKSLLLTSGFYQVGAIVELNSGALARVITQNPGAPLRPLVEVVLDRAGNHPTRRQILDLRDNLTLSIVRTVAKGTS